MKTEQVVKELEDVARRLGVEVRTERGGFTGGLCTIGETQVIVLNKRQPAEARLAVLAASLRSLPVDSVFIRPAVRKVLESSWDEEVEAEIDSEAFE